eukprot:SAG31_NODE_509_length_14732_cov_13.043600_8_plen_437_part_01
MTPVVATGAISVAATFCAIGHRVRKYSDRVILFRWVYDKPDQTLVRASPTLPVHGQVERSIDVTLATGTNFDAAEIQLLHCLYKDMQSAGLVHRDAFTQTFSPLLSANCASRLFAVFDRHGEASIDLFDFINGFSIISRGSVKEVLAFCLQLEETKGIELTKSAALSAIRGLVASVSDIDVAVSQTPKCVTNSDVAEAPGNIACDVSPGNIALGDTDADAADDAFNRDELLDWLNGQQTAHEFVASVRQAAQTVTGIIPGNKAEEFNFVSNALCNQTFTQEGNSVFLISQTWWDRWAEHCNGQEQHTDALVSCEDSDSSTGRPQDVDSQADEFDVSKQHARKQRRREDRKLATGASPGEIDNVPLLDALVASDAEATAKSAKVLRLKADLEEQRDFKLLPEKLWVTMQKWYGGGPVIRRKMIAHAEANGDVDIGGLR